jgi:hypothetical protein
MSTLLHKASPNPGGVCWIYDSDEDACEGYCFHEEKCPYCRVERAEAKVKELEVESQLLRDMAKTGEFQDSHDWWFPLDVRLRFAAFERVLRGEGK